MAWCLPSSLLSGFSLPLVSVLVLLLSSFLRVNPPQLLIPLSLVVGTLGDLLLGGEVDSADDVERTLRGRTVTIIGWLIVVGVPSAESESAVTLRGTRSQLGTAKAVEMPKRAVRTKLMRICDFIVGFGDGRFLG